jgi:hydroxymethylbilane synthase
MPTLRLGTRGSPLALYQARAVADALQTRAGVSCEIVVIRTSGDQMDASAPAGAPAPADPVGGKRLFVKEIEDALLAGTIDLAVHSSKDMPVLLPEGLRIGAVLPREDPRDALVLPEGQGGGHTLDEVRRLLGVAPVIGTSSVRRIAQLARVSPGARFVPTRGNVGTRLRKLDGRDYDALVLAAAGLARLGLGARVSALLPVEVSVPAPGQGIIAVEVRHGDRHEELNAIDDADASLALRAERAVVQRLGGGCQMPIGAYASISGRRLSVTGIVISPDGSRMARADASGSTVAPEDVGERAADELLAQGGDKILADVRRALSPAERHHT